MANIYDYANNIKVITTNGGDKVITMNEAIFTAIRNAIHDGSEYMEEKGYITKSLKEDDKRICLLYPTDKLKEVYDVLIEAEKEWTNIITEGLSEDDLELYKKFLSLSTELSAKYIHK